MGKHTSNNVFHRYVFGVICFILSVIPFATNASGSVNGFTYQTAVDSATKSISVNATKDGKNYKALIKPKPSSLKTALSARSLRGGAVGALLFLGTYYGITKTDDGTFQRLANESEWVWCNYNPCSSSPSEIANRVIQEKNATDNQFDINWTLDRYEISAAGVLLIYGLKTAISNGFDYGSSMISSIGGSPNPNPPSAEVVSGDQVANAILYDAFAIEGSEYYPSPTQVNDARSALLELYSTTAVGASETDQTVKDLSGVLINTAPSSTASDIKDATGATSGVLPDFCGWATAVCDYLYYDDPVLPVEESNPVVGDFETQFTDFNLVSINWTAQCPAVQSVSIPILTTSFDLQFDLSPMCDFLQRISSAIIALAYLSGAIIVATMGTARGES